MRQWLLVAGLVTTLMNAACLGKANGPYRSREYGLHYECGLFDTCGEPLQCMKTTVDGAVFRSCERACATDEDCQQGFGCGALRGSSQHVCLERLPNGQLLQPYFDS